jgi:hypothetical protein
MANSKILVNQWRNKQPSRCQLGHAMKAADPLKAFGAIIGKALRRLEEGQGLIPVLMALQ